MNFIGEIPQGNRRMARFKDNGEEGPRLGVIGYMRVRESKSKNDCKGPVGALTFSRRLPKEKYPQGGRQLNSLLKMVSLAPFVI